MIFESLGDKLQDTIGRLRGKGKVTEQDVDEAMREVKLALLEADVNFKVVKSFVKSKRTLLGQRRHGKFDAGPTGHQNRYGRAVGLNGRQRGKIDFQKVRRSS